ncbi:hypothetical protein FNV43_RR13857 [Rhamnella rubrinervis]|uniref:Glycosyltransferase n=1 Tax=Rhamnella rubrinervis TaxID=2594499 RepID=A0A8K0H1R9_9ROSA|nr:hypothetical protein FNV43_RR13857 [Rhamnella rubrinervis]
MEKSANLVFIPLPFMSHLKPAIELSKLIVTRHDHLSITIILMNLPFADSKTQNQLESLAASSPMLDRISIILLPQNLPTSETNPKPLVSSLLDHSKPHVKDALTKLDSPRLAGFVLDIVCVSMIDVANEFGVPAYMFYTVSSGFVSLMFHLQALRDNRNIDPTKLKDDPDSELPLPSFVNSVPSRVLPDFMLNKGAFTHYLDQSRRMREEAKGFVVNTFMELESHAVRHMFDVLPMPVYTVGPVLDLVIEDGNDSDLIKWLDDQPPSSVVFLCFGHLGSFREHQVKEIARALENCGIRFVWSLRRSPSSDGQNDVPSSGYADSMEEFLNRTAGMGKIIDWAPQVKILSHSAIGGFVSHCGWNSILESLWFGVPIATWPLYAEQQLNAFEMVRELGLAVEIKLDYFTSEEKENDRAVVNCQEIEAGIRRVMEHDSDVRKRVKDISEISRKAVMDGGSSWISLGDFVNDVLHNMP